MAIPDLEGLSPRQRHILAMIRDSIVHRGYPPTFREIGAAVGLSSPSSVSYQLGVLEEQGFLRRDARGSRAVILRDMTVDPRPGPTETHDTPASRRAVLRSVPMGDDPALADGPAGGYGRDPADGRGVVELRRARQGRVSGDVRVPLVGAIAAGAPIVADEQIEEELTLPQSMVGHGDLFALRVRGDSMTEAAIRDGDVVVIRRQPVADNGDFVAALLGDEATVKEFRRVDGHVSLVPHNPSYEAIPGDEAQILGKVVTVLRRLP
jgi:repressor LexA